VGNRTNQVCGTQTTEYVYSDNDQLLDEKLTDTADSANNRLTKRTYNGSRMTQEICYRSHTVLTANRLLQKDHSFAYDGRSTSTLYHWNMSGVFQLREYVRSFYDDLGLTVFTDHYENPVNDGNYTVKYRTRYMYDRLNPTGYAQVMRETFNNTITGSDVLLRTHSHTIGHERVSEKTTIALQPNAPQTYFFVHDGRSSTRALTDLTGTAVQRYDYDAFGNAVGFATSQALTKYLYCGELFDHILGWTYLRARYYDPRVGRFNRLDPFFGNLSDPQSLHKYTYCHGDPVNFTDPSGLFTLVQSMAIGGILSGLTALSIGTFIGHKWGGSSWYHASTQALSPFGVPLSVALSIISLPFGVLTAMFDYRALYNKWTFEGNGGEDATACLRELRENVIKTWSHLNPDQKLEAIAKLYAYGPSNWDIELLSGNKSIWTSDVINPAPDTLTFEGKVYAVAEINYVLWGIVNRLAYEDNIMVWQTNRTNTSNMVFIYRNTFGWVINIDQWREGNLNYFETTGGKMSWADYGWNWVKDPHASIPTGTSLYHAKPSTIPKTVTLHYNFGGVTGPK